MKIESEEAMNKLLLYHQQLWMLIAEHDYNIYYANERQWRGDIKEIGMHVKKQLCSQICEEHNLKFPENSCFLCEWVLQQENGKFNNDRWQINCNLCPGKWNERGDLKFCATAGAYYNQWYCEYNIKTKRKLAWTIAHNVHYNKYAYIR